MNGITRYILHQTLGVMLMVMAGPVLLAPWTPGGMTWVLGVSMLLHLEDG
jgi:hypothetical protein